AFSVHHPILFVAGFALCQIGQRPVMSVFWSIPPIFLAGTAAASGIALINSIGNIGGQVGSEIMGRLVQRTGSYRPGLFVLAGALLLQALLVISIRLPKEKPSTP